MRMKTYNEYYSECKEDGKKSVSVSENIYGKNWWQKTNNGDNSKNDAPIIKNETNVPNSDWITLHTMLSEMVIDYMRDNNINENIYSYSINVNLGKVKRKWSMYLKTSTTESIKLPDETIDIPTFPFVSDERIINEFDWLNKYIYGNVYKFVVSKNIEDTVGSINFSIDNIRPSVDFGKWCPSSDSSLSAYGLKEITEPLVVSM